MKFLCFSDTHGRVPPANLANTAGDVVLHAGDVYDRLSKGMVPSPKNLNLWTKAGKDFYAVRGNHDILDPDGVFSGGQDLTERVVELTPSLYLIGLGWHGERFYELPRESDMATVCSQVVRQAIVRIPTGGQSIIVSHYPAHLPKLFSTDGPYEGWMFDCIAQMITTFQPIAIIQGHVHELAGATGKIDNTLVLFPGPDGGVLDVDLKAGVSTYKELK